LSFDELADLAFGLAIFDHGRLIAALTASRSFTTPVANGQQLAPLSATPWQ
jgi:hypothetical protein